MAKQELQTTFPGMLKQFEGEIARALPKHLNPERMARIALTAFRRTPKLAKCDPRSVFAAVIQASQLGLEPDTLGRAYLIPYGTECQFIPGWKGLVDLLNRSGQGSVYTGVIYKDQKYTYSDGSKRELIVHNESEYFEPEHITHVFAVGTVTGSDSPIIEFWPIKKVWKHRDRYNKVGKRHYSFENQEMYARKVVLLQVLKYMPSSPELSQAIALNDAAEINKQHINIDDAIDGTWTPVEEDETPQPQQQRREPDPLPPLTDEEFQSSHDSWMELIGSGRQTAAALIAMLSTRYALTDAQKKTIESFQVNNA